MTVRSRGWPAAGCGVVDMADATDMGVSERNRIFLRNPDAIISARKNEYISMNYIQKWNQLGRARPCIFLLIGRICRSGGRFRLIAPVRDLGFQGQKTI
jgi:hypothetical protein